MTSKVYVVTDLGPGDGGKGGVVHKLVQSLQAHTVIKDGGAQGSHGVRTATGVNFAFSQWGCGTLEGVPTFVGPRFVVSPEGLLNEARALREVGIDNPFALLSIDERCLCSTHFHGISSRLKELARGKNPRGTIGTGVGEAQRYAERLPQLDIRMHDLARSDLRDRLAAVREHIRTDLAEILASDFLPEDKVLAQQEAALLYDDDYLDFIVSRFREVGVCTRIASAEYFGSVVLRREGVAVVERSHGVLTDARAGFHPHTSASRTLPRFVHEMVRRAGYEGAIVNIGIHRAYSIRHGAGPLPTADPKLGERLLPGSCKSENRWQGKVRVGALDLPLLRYAIAVSGGMASYDALAITWFDQVAANGEWLLCNRYKGVDDDSSYFTQDGELRADVVEGEEGLECAERLGKEVSKCVPEIEKNRIPQNATKEELARLCAEVLNPRLGIPVRLVSLGPTEVDKVPL